MPTINAYAASEAGATLEQRAIDIDPLGPEEVEVQVEHCGICHSDLSMLDNEWGMSQYPLVAGHEAVGTIVAMGDQVKGLRKGQRVGVGWNAGSCLHCPSCVEGEQHLCRSVQPTIAGHHGAFADRVRAHWLWAIPMPDGIAYAEAGPLLCGGITVFAPLLHAGIQATDRVGVVGIGGLGHMAIKFAAAWGCEVTAFTSSASKHDEAKAFGAHHVLDSTDEKAMESINGSLDLLIVTVNVSLDWHALLNTLGPNGRLHMVGAVLEPMPIQAFDLIMAQRSIAGSPTGSRSAIDTMLDFAARHNIAPQTEHFPMSEVNDALDHLRSGKARYRIVLDG